MNAKTDHARSDQSGGGGGPSVRSSNGPVPNVAVRDDVLHTSTAQWRDHGVPARERCSVPNTPHVVPVRPRVHVVRRIRSCTPRRTVAVLRRYRNPTNLQGRSRSSRKELSTSTSGMTRTNGRGTARGALRAQESRPGTYASVRIRSTRSTVPLRKPRSAWGVPRATRDTTDERVPAERGPTGAASVARPTPVGNFEAAHTTRNCYSRQCRPPFPDCYRGSPTLYGNRYWAVECIRRFLTVVVLPK